MISQITNVQVLVADTVIPDATVTIDHGVVTKIGKSPDENTVKLNGHGGLLMPGMVDVHLHGANGYDMMDGTTQTVQQVSRYVLKTGCTAFLATSVTSSPEDLMQFIVGVKQVVGEEPGARILGIHLEGPYLNVQRKGMQNAKYLRNPDRHEMENIIAQADGLVKMVTLAPELPGGMEMVEFLHGQGIVVAMAHTEATYEEAKQAFSLGASHITHCFNAMPSIHHRNPGMILAAFEDPRVTCQAIVDGVHLHPATVRLMHRNLGYRRMVLTTDAMQGMGLPDGSYSFGGHDVRVAQGVARLSDGTLASSTGSMVQSLKTAVEAGINVFDAAQMASVTPYSVLSPRPGNLAEGAKADLVLVQRDLAKIEWVMLDGVLQQG